MNAERRYTVRHMSREDAAKEAMRLAEILLTDESNGLRVLTVESASPSMIDPRPVGKTPTQWIVSTRFASLDSPNAVIDGADPLIVVDLLTEQARFA